MLSVTLLLARCAVLRLFGLLPPRPLPRSFNAGQGSAGRPGGMPATTGCDSISTGSDVEEARHRLAGNWRRTGPSFASTALSTAHRPAPPRPRAGRSAATLAAGPAYGDDVGAKALRPAILRAEHGPVVAACRGIVQHGTGGDPEVSRGHRDEQRRSEPAGGQARRPRVSVCGSTRLPSHASCRKSFGRDGAA